MPTYPLRVAHVITRLIVGGAQENTLASVLGLIANPAFEVQLVAGPTHGPEGSLVSSTSPIASKFTEVPSLVRPLHPWKDLRAVGTLTRLFRQQQPHIVHTHSGKAGFVGRIAAHRARVPIIVHTIHGPSFGSFQGPLPNILFRTAERWAGAHTHHFVVVAQAMRDQYLQAGIGNPDQYTRIFSGFPLKPFLEDHPDPTLRHQLGIEPSDIVIGKVARLTHLKGHADLLEAAPTLLSSLPQLRFLFVGDGNLRHQLESLALRLRIQSRIIFTGLVPPESIPAYLRQMDLLVHLSRREGLARALPQALAVGRPVVAYDCDGAREICQPSHTGLLVPTGNRPELIHAVLQLAHNPELRAALGRRGRAFVQRHFPVEIMVQSLADLYARLAAQLLPRNNTTIPPAPDAAAPT